MDLLNKNDRVRLHFKDHKGERIFEATVNWCERRFDPQNGEFIYFGYIPDDMSHGQWGCATFYEKKRPYGCVKVEVLGHIEPKSSPQPINLFRNPGYDLIRDPWLNPKSRLS